MQQRCPSCGRAWVPGEARCPFCGAGPAAVPSPHAAPAPPMPAPGGPVFQLEWTDRRGMPRSQALNPQGVRVGRGTMNDIVVPDELASRDHAVFWCQGGQCFVRDTGSTNGTFVNGQRISGTQTVRPGDQVTIGQTTFRVVQAVAAVPAAPPAVPGAPPPVPPGRYPAHVPPAAPPAAPAQPAAPGVPAQPGVPAGPVAATTAPASIITVGRGVSLAGVLAILLMFFMPWVSCTDPLSGESVSFSGYDIAIASSPSIAQAFDLSGAGDPAPGMPPALLFVIPAAGLLVLILGVVTLFLPDRQQLPLQIIQVGLAVVAAAGLLWFYVDLNRLGELTTLYTLEIGYWGSWGAVLAIAVGAILDLAGVGVRRRG